MPAVAAPDLAQPFARLEHGMGRRLDLPAQTEIPGVEPYDSSQGWDVWLEWVKTLNQKVGQAQAEGKIPKDLFCC